MKATTAARLAIPAIVALAALVGAAAAAAAPAIEAESASNIKSTDATLEAQINPQSVERGALYQFQLVTDASEYLPEFVCPTEGFPANTSLCLGLATQAGALPIREAPAGVQVQSVSLDLTSAGMTLQPNTTYRYRVIAARKIQTVDTIEWEEPTVYGADQTFTTPSNSSPSIISESASNVTTHDATLEAQINPDGLETSYQFRVVASPCHANPLNCELVSDPLFPSVPGKIAPASVGKSVSLDLNSAGLILEPGREYHYAVFATNEAGTESGLDQTFVTSPAAALSIESESASNITATDATLGAQINLHEAPAGVHYQFQLVTDPSEYASEILCPPTLQPGTDGCIGPQGSAALPIGFLPGNTLQPGATLGASLDLASASVTLQPGRTYHYRVLVARRVQTVDTIEWEAPTVYGADQTFTTAPDPAPSSSQPSAAEGQSPAIQSPPAATPSHRGRHHRPKHKRQQHRANLHRGNRAG